MYVWEKGVFKLYACFAVVEISEKDVFKTIRISLQLELRKRDINCDDVCIYIYM